MSFKSCQCSMKILQIENKLSQVIQEITQLKNTPFNCKIQNSNNNLVKDNFTETFLLDFSQKEPYKYTLGSVNQAVTKLDQKLKEIQLKCSILSSLKESISKQTQIIYFLENKIQNKGNFIREKEIYSKLTSNECTLIPDDFQTSHIIFRKEKIKEHGYKQSQVYEVM